MAVQKILELKAQDGLDFEKRLQFKEQGLPRPNLYIKQTSMDKNKEVHRNFNQSMYDLSDWLCGCDTRNALFCFPCLLFSDDPLWCKTGVIDLKHLKTKVQQHLSSANHMKSSMDFAILGNVDIKLQLNSAYRKSIKDFNESVDKNRYILNKIIDCIKFCGTFELALHETSKDPDIFRGLINFVSELDSIFKDHIHNSRIFKRISKPMQNDLLDSMLAVIQDKIKSEIEQADFIAIQVDETTDSSNKPQIVFIVRYILSGVAHERFWKFINPLGTTAQELTNEILKELEILKVNVKPEKLIGQSYDGASVMSGKFGCVQAKVRQNYPSANFIHCYAHQLNLILQKAASQNKHIRIFFANLLSFSSFFEKSPKQIAVLDEVIKVTFPGATPKRWYFNTKSVETVFTYQNEILTCMEKIIDTEEEPKTLNQAIGLKNYLQNEDFLHWLDFFHQIMPRCDMLFKQLQQPYINVISVKKYFSDFKSDIETVRDKIMNNLISAPPSTSSKQNRNDDSKHRIALEVCDIIVSEVEHRFRFTNHLIISQLFQVDRFEQYKNCFPQNVLKLVKTCYPFINDTKLKTELTVLYDCEDFYNSSGPIAVLQLFINNDLCQTFSESEKLIKIICTLPITRVESEHSFSTLNRIITFLRNTMEQEKLCALAMLSIEKSLVKNIDNFNELVINHFANAKERGVDFKYKSS